MKHLDSNVDLAGKTPLLPPIQGGKRFTLVLDLDETLVHFDEETDELAIRPYAPEFLQEMA
jgi:hypothetical protein